MPAAPTSSLMLSPDALAKAARMTGSHARRRARTSRCRDTLIALAHRDDLLRSRSQGWSWPPCSEDMFLDLDEAPPIPEDCLAGVLLSNPDCPPEAITAIVTAVKDRLDDPHVEPIEAREAWPEVLLTPTLSHRNCPPDLHLQWADTIRATALTLVMSEFLSDRAAWREAGMDVAFNPESVWDGDPEPEVYAYLIAEARPFTVAEALQFAHDTLSQPKMSPAPRGLRAYREQLAGRFVHAILALTTLTPDDLTAALRATTRKRYARLVPGILAGVVRNRAATAAHLDTALALARQHDGQAPFLTPQPDTFTDKILHAAAHSSSPAVLTHMLTTINPALTEWDFEDVILSHPNLPAEVVREHSRAFLTAIRAHRRVPVLRVGSAIELVRHRHTDPDLITWLTTHKVPWSVTEALIAAQRLPLPELMPWTFLTKPGRGRPGMTRRREMLWAAKRCAVAIATPESFATLTPDMKKKLLSIHGKAHCRYEEHAPSMLSLEVLQAGASDADPVVRRAASRALLASVQGVAA